MCVCVCVCVCVCDTLCVSVSSLTESQKTESQRLGVQGGEDTYNALSCRSFFAKEPLIIGLLCGK